MLTGLQHRQCKCNPVHPFQFAGFLLNNLTERLAKETKDAADAAAASAAEGGGGSAQPSTKVIGKGKLPATESGGSGADGGADGGGGGSGGGGRGGGSGGRGSGGRDGGGKEEGEEDEKNTWVSDIFQGQLTNEIQCMCCETVVRKSIDRIPPRICSRTLMGCSDPPLSLLVFSRGGSLLPSNYADTRYIDDVIAF